MSVTFLSVGYDNFVVAERIVAIVGCSSAPIRRLIQESRQNGKLLDATQGRRMRSVVLMDSGILVTSALSQETLVRRAAGARPTDTGDPAEPSENSALPASR